MQPEDSEIEVSHLPNATLVVIPSVWGHVGEQSSRLLGDDEIQISSLFS